MTRNCCKMAARHKKIPAVVCVRLLLGTWVRNTGVIASASWNLGRTTCSQCCRWATPTVVAPWSSHAMVLRSCLGGAMSECSRTPTPAFIKLSDLGRRSDGTSCGAILGSLRVVCKSYYLGCVHLCIWCRFRAGGRRSHISKFHTTVF